MGTVTKINSRWHLDLYIVTFLNLLLFDSCTCISQIDAQDGAVMSSQIEAKVSSNGRQYGFSQFRAG